jgi:hypothetical protein
MDRNPGAGDWLKAGISGLETVNQSLKLINRVMGGH